MTHSAFGASCAPASPAQRSLPNSGDQAVSSSRETEAELARVRNAIVRCWHRIEAAQRKSDWEAEVGARDDFDRLSNTLARISVGA